VKIEVKLQTCLWVACYARCQPGSLDSLPSWFGLEPGQGGHLAPACLFCYQIVMAKSTLSDNRKKRIGRPPVGAILIGVRVPPAGVAELDAWIKKHAPDLSRPEAIRRLVDLGLTVKVTARAVSKPDRRLRAAELAAKAIDKIGDPAAPPEERAQRRRRLTTGPEEFREVRVDRPKLKK
jgi:hypothetical protein